MVQQPYFGPTWLGRGRVRFRIWAPTTERAELHLDGRSIPLRRHRDDTHSVVVDRVPSGARYRYVLDGDGPFPDPWSHWQPEGVHGPSEVLPPFPRAAHIPVPRGRAQATYEMHIGTFSPAGDYRGATARLRTLKRLGVDTIQVMPVAEFPGRWNWGYDGTYLQAPTRAYGNPRQLRAFVARAHQEGLSVLLDAVFNHLGPDGAYIYRYAPAFFTDLHQTPWGGAIDYKRREVRRTVVDAAAWWIRQYGFDGLRLDATHAIYDSSAVHILADVAASCRKAFRGAYIVAEDHRNEAGLVRRDRLDAILADDFHHAVRVTLTAEQDGYFSDYRGGAAEIATAIRDGWIHQGARTGSAGPGSATTGLPAEAFVFCIENHDQVGNRARALHLAGLAGTGEFAAASTLLMLSPERVMLFQGQEYGSQGNFFFFTDHKSELGRLVTTGRRKEFRHFREFRDHPERIPDPQAPETFRRSRLDWDERRRNGPARRLYEELFRLRLHDPVLSRPDRERTRVWHEGDIVYLERTAGRRIRLLAATLTGVPGAALPPGRVLFHTEERRFGGGGRPTLSRPAAVLIDPLS